MLFKTLNQDRILLENKMVLEENIKDILQPYIQKGKQILPLSKAVAQKFKLPLALVVSVALSLNSAQAMEKPGHKPLPIQQEQPVEKDWLTKASDLIPSKESIDQFLKNNFINADDVAYVKKTYLPDSKEIITDAAILGLIVATVTSGGFLDPILISIGVDKFGLNLFSILAARGINISLDTIAQNAEDTPVKEIAKFTKEHKSDIQDLKKIGSLSLGG